MGQDYYFLLNLTRSATDADIKNAYRKFALKFHPQRRSNDPLSNEKFIMIAEAYDVLSDPRKRAVYDQFGEEGLKTGVPHGSGNAGAWTEGYTFHGDADKVFKEFFGSENPFQEFYDRVDGDMHMSFGGLHGRGQKKQDPPIERDLSLTLEELYHGCVKKMKISRRVMNEDGHTSSIRDKILSITVKKGWKENTKITFPKEGDQGPNNIPADIVFVVKDRPHPRFKRVGADLIHVADIPLGRALTEYVVDVHTLDDRIIHVPITSIVHPNYVKVVPDEGMPLLGDSMKRGDLLIHFNIVFPKKLNLEQRRLIEQALC